MPAVNQTELRIIGMSRSGNHPIIHWIRRQARGRVCFLNCAEPQTNPFQSCRPLASGRRAVTNYRPFHLRREAAGKFSKKDWLLYSYEDCFLTMVHTKLFEERHDEFVGASRKRINILILRDPFNLFASRMHSEFGGVTPKTAVRIWKQHAKHFAGERKLLPAPSVEISYNRWASDRQYRREIASELGLQFTDRGAGEVSRTGGGSSFDGMKFRRQAEEMPTMKRWRRFQRNREYRQLLDEEMLALAEKNFELDRGMQRFAARLRRRTEALG